MNRGRAELLLRDLTDAALPGPRTVPQRVAGHTSAGGLGRVDRRVASRRPRQGYHTAIRGPELTEAVADRIKGCPRITGRIPANVATGRVGVDPAWWAD